MMYRSGQLCYSVEVERKLSKSWAFFGSFLSMHNAYNRSILAESVEPGGILFVTTTMNYSEVQSMTEVSSELNFVISFILANSLFCL